MPSPQKCKSPQLVLGGGSNKLSDLSRACPLVHGLLVHKELPTLGKYLFSRALAMSLKLLNAYLMKIGNARTSAETSIAHAEKKVLVKGHFP